MVNPFNPDAGATPAPTAPADLERVERSARVMWRAFPYFAWRYGERGRSFGRSDAGYLVTLLQLDERAASHQVAWLAGVLAPRGMPGLLLEVQLRSLGRIWRRDRAPGAARFDALASAMRAARLTALDEHVFTASEQLCRAAAKGVRRRRGAGTLIAAAVADRLLGHGAHDETLVRWFSEAEGDDLEWARACAGARGLAQTHARQPPEGDP